LCLAVTLAGCARSATTSYGSDAPDGSYASTGDSSLTETSVSASEDSPGEEDASVGGSDAASDGGPDVAEASCAQYLGPAASSASTWAYADASGHLQYRALSAQGDRMMDFSYAGYMGGGVTIPTVPVVQTVHPSGGDDTPAIQAAIDAASSAPLKNGVRGAVMLAAGNYTIAGALSMAASGVVLRGAGSGPGGTLVNVTGGGRQFMTVHGSGAVAAATGAVAATVTDPYVPAGATTLHVDQPAAVSVGDAVLVQRPVTAAWVHFMGMDTLTRNGAPQTWLAPGTNETWQRTVMAVTGNALSLDIPLSDSIDAQYAPGASVVRSSFPGRITQVGIEDIQFVSPVRALGEEFAFARFDAAADGWVRRTVVHNFTNGIWLGPGVKRFTVEDTTLSHDPTTYVTSEAPFDIWIEGSETLVQRTASSGGNKIWYYATQVLTVGPNVLLNLNGSGTTSHVTGHQRWATGLLVDSGNVAGGITFQDNGTLGSGEGWSMGWGVVWNTKSDVLVQAPPGAMNWSIGVTGSGGSGAGLGTYESQNAPVRPASLYLAQLCERLGAQAVTASGN
jgi:hypothetical protein